jgi:hypothetical protein
MKFDNQNPIFTFLLMGVGFGFGTYLIRRLLGGHSNHSYNDHSIKKSHDNYQQVTQNKDSKINFII